MNDFAILLAQQPAPPNIPFDGVFWGVAGAGAILLVVLVWRWLRRKPKKLCDDDAANLTIDVSRLDASGPVAGAPRLEFYGVPVRLAVLVIAPAGRAFPLPDAAELPNLIEGIAPGLMRVVASHQPTFRRWGAQLSVHGFVSSFQGNVALPGDKGKQTPWSSIAGKFEVAGQQFLAGLVCCAAAPNSLTQVVVQHIGQWHEVLRVK